MENYKIPEPGKQPEKKPTRFPRGLLPWLAILTLFWVATSMFNSNRPQAKAAAMTLKTGPGAEAPIKNANVLYMQYPLEKTQSAIDDVRTALKSAKPDVEAAAAAIEQADQSLKELTDYYLPLTEARDHLVQAYDEHLAGLKDLRDGSLAAAGNKLTWIVENGTAPMENDTGELLTLLNSLELHKQTDPEFTEDLRNLCEKVQEHLVRASLKLEEPGRTAQ